MANPAYTGGSVEVDLPWGGDFSFDGTGDLVLAFDTQSNQVATNERLIRLVLTAPNIVVNGQAVAYADDLFHPTWGAGLRAYVDANFTQASLAQLANAVRAQLSADAAVAPSPAPTVVSTLVSATAAFLQISYYTTAGTKQTMPTINLSPTSVTVPSS